MKIKDKCQEIVQLLNDSKNGMFYRKYKTVLKDFNLKRRSKKVLDEVDQELKRNEISIWKNKEQMESIWDFSKTDTITFKMNKFTSKLPKTNSEQKFTKEGKKKVENKNAGSIKIANGKSGIAPYQHQKKAIEKLNLQIIATKKNPFEGLLVLPTGGGKTLTVAYWIAKNFLDKSKKVLWIAHRHELLEQAKSTFKNRLAFTDIFKEKSSFNYRLISGIHDKPVRIKPTDDIIISSKDSLNSGFEYLQKNWLNGTEEVLLIIDEAHHATAKTYRKLIENIKKEVRIFKMIGLTATPFRTAESEKGLLIKVFPDDIIHKVDLKTLVTKGILSEPHFEEIKTNYKIEEDELIKIKESKFSDFGSLSAKTLKTISENSKRNRVIVDKYKNNKAKYEQTLVFAINKDNAIALNKLFNEQGIKSEYVLSGVQDSFTGVTTSSRENKEKIDKFRNKEIDILINVNILTEGTDLPNVQSIFLARPTISTILMTQMIGRGLRGVKAGGTEKAYIVSFVDDWQDKVSWVNPEKLLIQENLDFSNKQVVAKEQILKLISISKLEEFAMLTDEMLKGTAKRKNIESLDFIERIPLGIYHFSILNKEAKKDELEKICEVLVFSNIEQSYRDFINALPYLFKQENIINREYLSETDLDKLSKKIEEAFFFGCAKYPGFDEQDIKDILQYYAQNELLPRFIEFKDRKNYDISKIANEIENLTPIKQKNHIENIWEREKDKWEAFFGLKNKKSFREAIQLSLNKKHYPEDYQTSNVVPKEEKEMIDLDKFDMNRIRKENHNLWKYLSDTVYNNSKDSEGNYVCAKSGFKSKNKLAFQIDHIKPISKDGLTTLKNLQLLTRKENARKGAK